MKPDFPFQDKDILNELIPPAYEWSMMCIEKYYETEPDGKASKITGPVYDIENATPAKYMRYAQLMELAKRMFKRKERTLE